MFVSGFFYVVQPQNFAISHPLGYNTGAFPTDGAPRMKRSFVVFVVTVSLFTGTAAAQDSTAPKNEINELRAEVERVEAEIARLTTRLNELNASLAKIDARQPAANRRPLPPPPFRFSIGIERAMMGEAISRPSIKLERENELIDDNKLRPGRSGPVIPPRK